MSARRLLIITYYFPPSPSIGGARWAAMSEWLRRLGHEVTVLTTKAGGPSDDDGGWVLRTADVSAMASVRKLLRRPPARSAEAAQSIQKPPPRWFTDIVVPDEYLFTWGLPALASVRRAIREREIDCVITSGPPQSTHLLPLLLGARRPAWIADFRDGWRFEPLRPPWPMRAQDRLDGALERRVARSADVVIGVTRPIATDTKERLTASSAYIPNGWDPDFDRRLEGVAAPPLDPSYVNVVHTGKLSGPRGRDPQPLFAAMRQLAANRPAVASRLRLTFAGRLDTEDERLLCKFDLRSVKHVGSLSRAAALALQREADVLLLLTSSTHISEATGKLFEYLAAGRPILALANGNEAARIVGETGAGIVVHPHDVDGIEQALAAAVDGALTASYAPHGLTRYIYPRPAEEVADLVERAIAQRACSDDEAQIVRRVL
jgi:glycosyltransferase involved in cell wall biosynthesis